jgi:hypothetical protein
MTPRPIAKRLGSQGFDDFENLEASMKHMEDIRGKDKCPKFIILNPLERRDIVRSSELILKKLDIELPKRSG